MSFISENENGHVVKRSHFFASQIMIAFVSNMEWSVSDDVNDDVMAFQGSALVGPLLFL